MEHATLENHLNGQALDLILGKSPEKIAQLQAEFRKTGLVIVPDCLSASGLAEVRRHFDELGMEFELPNPDKAVQERIFDRYAQHTRRNAFVRALMEDSRFTAFLERVTGRTQVKIRKANVAIRFKQDAVTPPWHFDGPRVSLVVPIDAPPPGAGGEFGYFPMLRRRGEPKWLRSMRGMALRLRLHRLVRKPHIVPYAPGSIILFDGETTYHRALSLTKPSLRRSLLFFFNDGTAEDSETDMMM